MNRWRDAAELLPFLPNRREVVISQLPLRTSLLALRTQGPPFLLSTAGEEVTHRSFP